MKTLAALALLFVVNSAFASEVGTPNPQVAKAETLELAIAEKGAGERWTTGPLNFKPTKHQIAEFNKAIDAMNAEVNAGLRALLDEKLELSLQR